MGPVHCRVKYVTRNVHKQRTRTNALIEARVYYFYKHKIIKIVWFKLKNNNQNKLKQKKSNCLDVK